MSIITLFHGLSTNQSEESTILEPRRKTHFHQVKILHKLDDIPLEGGNYLICVSRSYYITLEAKGIRYHPKTSFF